MTIAEIHDFIDLITSKERNGFNTPAEKDAALDRANLTLFDYYKPLYSKSIEAKEALAPFRVRYDYTTNGTGEITLTSGQDFVHLLSMDVMVNDPDSPSGYDPDRRYPVEFISEDELADRLNSQNKQPTRTSPIADILGVGWYDLYPTVVHSGAIYFLKRPAKPVYAYSQAGRTITYNAGASTQLQWTEPYLNKVIFLAIRYLGINLNAEQIINYSTELVKEGI
jgi:hypothetical protein